jgi:hypothetical protein
MADNVQKIISVELRATSAINGIKDLNAQIEKNQKEMRQLSKDHQKGSEEYARLEQHTKALQKAKQTLSRETQNEIKLEYEQKGSLNALRAELSNLTKQYDGLSRAERENVNVGGKLQKQINQVTNEIKSAEQSTQRYYRNVGNYENAILNTIGLNNNFARSLIGITNAQGGITGAFSAMGGSIKAFGATLMGLLSNPVFLAIAGIAGVGMAFKWFYDYNEGLAEATRLTREFTGYAGDDLIAMRNKIQATADVMGKDFKDTLATADTLMANFHISGGEAMDVINKGFASGADLNGDMLQKMQQLAPTFHDAGIAADEMVAIIQQTRSGIFTDQGLEAIRQGSARIREMSSSTRQALQGIGIDVDQMQAKLRDGSMTTFDAIKQVSAQLKTLPDNAQEVGEVMTAVFGRQGKFASQEMIESLAEMSTSLDEVTAQTGEYGELLLENISTEEELDNVTSALFDMTDKGWEEMKQQATIYAKKALVEVVKGLVDVANWFINLYNKSMPVRAAVNLIAGQFKTVWAAAKQAFRLIIDGFKAIGRGINAVVNMFSQAGNAISAFGRGVYDIFAGIFNRSLEQINRGWNTLKNGVSSAVKSSWDGIMSALTASWEENKEDWGKFGTEIANIAMDAFENTVNGHLNNITVPLLTATGGGGGGGGGNSTNTNTNTSNGGGGGGKRGGGSTRKPSTPKNTSTTAKSGKTEEEKAEEERLKRIQALIKKAAELELKAREEVQKQTAEGIVQMYKERADAIFAQFEGIETKTTEEAEALMKAKNTMLKANLEAQKKDLDKLKAEQDKKIADEKAKAQADAKALTQALLDGTTEGTQAHLDYQLELIRMEKEAELALYENNEQMKAAIIAKYNKQEEDARKQHSQAIQQIEQTKYEAIGGMVGGLGEIVGAFGEQSKEAAVLQKTLALGEIMIAQAVAIANAVKAGSNAISPWQMIAQIATSIVAVTTAMAQAFASLDSARFATGGYIRGAGTGTSDSIPVRVSNGESIMNANTTAMFSGLLSSLNQLGGGVPFQATQSASSIQGEDMLARAVAKGVAMLPNPVVSVEDINRGQRQVIVMNERARL